MLNLQPPAEAGQTAAEGARKGFDAGEVIIEHVSNTSVGDPLIHLPKVLSASPGSCAVTCGRIG